MSDIIEQVRHELMNNSDEKTKESVKRFFKEEVRRYGVYQYVLSKRDLMPRTALRYAIEKMPMARKRN